MSICHQPRTVFYNFSGGMESAAMLVIERERIAATQALVTFANTGKQFPEMQDSIAQIESQLNIQIIRVPIRIPFDVFLFERGGMLRKGMTDCSRRMKRANLMRYMQSLPKPWEVNLGFNADEGSRADAFVERNERPWCHWRFPLLEGGIFREGTWKICEDAGFSILVGMYRKMGRFDCYFCPNQTPRQALRVAEHYPALAKEWMEIERRKGHSIMSIPMRQMLAEHRMQGQLFEKSTGCSCFGGTEDMWEEEG